VINSVIIIKDDTFSNKHKVKEKIFRNIGENIPFTLDLGILESTIEVSLYMPLYPIWPRRPLKKLSGTRLNAIMNTLDTIGIGSKTKALETNFWLVYALAVIIEENFDTITVLHNLHLVDKRKGFLDWEFKRITFNQYPKVCIEIEVEAMFKLFTDPPQPTSGVYTVSMKGKDKKDVIFVSDNTPLFNYKLK
jgi:hypothetical protein